MPQKPVMQRIPKVSTVVDIQHTGDGNVWQEDLHYKHG
jgi:hypothetical protein